MKYGAPQNCGGAVGEALIGRVDPLGRPLDGKGRSKTDKTLHWKNAPDVQTQSVNTASADRY